MNDWDMMGKAKKVQEAAAEAILAERKRFEKVLKAALTSDGGTAFANDSEYMDEANPFPSDPYSISQISQIPSKYLWLSDRDPSKLAGKHKIVSDVAKDLAMTIPDGIGNLQSVLADKHKFAGKVTDRFATFLDNVVDVAENQSAMASEMATAVNNMDKLLTAAGKDMSSITDETITALNAIRDNDSGKSGAMGFAITSAVIGVAGAASGGTAAIAWALLSGAVGVAAEDTKGDSISADRVEDLLDKMFEEIADRVEKFDAREDKLVKALNDDIDLAQKHRSELDPDTKASNMYDGRGDTKPGPAALTVDFSQAYNYATKKVPKVAKQFSSAANTLSGASSTGINAMGKASTPWETLCSTLRRCSARTANHLNDGGETLAKAVQDFAEQDGSNAKWIDQEVKEADDVWVPGKYSPPTTTPRMGLGDFR